MSVDRRRLLAGSALGLSSLALPRAVAAASVTGGGSGELAPMQVVEVSNTGCNSLAGTFDVQVVLDDDGNYDIRFSLSGATSDDWLMPLQVNYGEGWDDQIYLRFQISDPDGCQSTTLTAIKQTPTIRVGRFVNGALESVSEPLTVA